MRLEARKLLYDMQQAGELILEFTQERTFEEYHLDAMLRSAVERQFEIIGEALGQLVKLEPGVAERISESGRIISFRNRLIHGYASVSSEIVWGIVFGKLPRLIQEVETLLSTGE